MGKGESNLTYWTDTELSNEFNKHHGVDWFGKYKEYHCLCGKVWPCDIAILKEMIDRKESI